MGNGIFYFLSLLKRLADRPIFYKQRFAAKAAKSPLWQVSGCRFFKTVSRAWPVGFVA